MQENFLPRRLTRWHDCLTKKVCAIANIIVKLKKKNHQQQLLKAAPSGFSSIADHGKCEAGGEVAKIQQLRLY
jgi:hypothetical protein